MRAGAKRRRPLLSFWLLWPKAMQVSSVTCFIAASGCQARQPRMSLFDSVADHCASKWPCRVVLADLTWYPWDQVVFMSDAVSGSVPAVRACTGVSGLRDPHVDATISFAYGEHVVDTQTVLSFPDIAGPIIFLAGDQYSRERPWRSFTAEGAVFDVQPGPYVPAEYLELQPVEDVQAADSPNDCVK